MILDGPDVSMSARRVSRGRREGEALYRTAESGRAHCDPHVRVRCSIDGCV